MSELLPCPFCGGEQDVHEDWCYFEVLARSINGRASEKELDEAWNTRAERTCEGCKHAAQNRHKDPCYACDRNTAARGDDYYEVVSE